MDALLGNILRRTQDRIDPGQVIVYQPVHVEPFLKKATIRRVDHRVALCVGCRVVYSDALCLAIQAKTTDGIAAAIAKAMGLMVKGRPDPFRPLSFLSFPAAFGFRFSMLA
jgi:hypothetical protein